MSLLQKPQAAASVGAPVAQSAAPAPEPKAPTADQKAAETAPKPAEEIPQLTPEQLPPERPHVSFQDGLLTVQSQNSTLSDILKEIRRATGSVIDVPAAASRERVAAQFSGSPREVITSLLDGSNLGYIIVPPPEDPNGLQKVILTVMRQEAAGSGGAAAAPGGAAPASEASADYSLEEQQDLSAADENPEPAPPPPPTPPKPSPGMPPRFSSAAAPTQPQGGQDQGPAARSPQQLLEQLQHMQQNQQQ
jgi:hypothetical protein